MRNISFAMTTHAFLTGQKTVTRRLGWKNAKAGDRLMAVKKAMGLKKGEKMDLLGEIEITRVDHVFLDSISAADVAAEGYPGMKPEDFVKKFCEAMGCCPDAVVTRLEFRRVT